MANVEVTVKHSATASMTRAPNGRRFDPNTTNMLKDALLRVSFQMEQHTASESEAAE